jgi:hypothetical protein
LYSNEIILCWVEPARYMGTGQRFQTPDGTAAGFLVITNMRILFFFASYLVCLPIQATDDIALTRIEPHDI